MPDTNQKNKVEFGLENVYFAKATLEQTDGTITYDKPVKWPGAVELSLEPSGDLIKFKADNIDYVHGVTTTAFAFTSLLTIPVFNQMWVYILAVRQSQHVSADCRLAGGRSITSLPWLRDRGAQWRFVLSRRGVLAACGL